MSLSPKQCTPVWFGSSMQCQIWRNHFSKVFVFLFLFTQRYPLRSTNTIILQMHFFISHHALVSLKSVYMNFGSTKCSIKVREMSFSFYLFLYLSFSHCGECGHMCILWESPASFCQEELSLADRWASGHVTSMFYSPAVSSER